MLFGVPRETHRNEHRVGLSPYAIKALVQHGHSVCVEAGAGVTAHFLDEDYKEAGAQIVYGTDEVYQRADVVCRIGKLPSEELELVKPGSTICAFHHLAVAPRSDVERFMELEATLIGYEIVRDDRGKLPVLFPFSEMAGQMAVHLAAYYLQTDSGGRGVLMGNVPGVPPPTVLILGAGVAGRTAARHARASGSHVIILDADLAKLRDLDRQVAGHTVTVVASKDRLDRYTAIADVIIGAVLIPGERAPFLVTETMVKNMKPGSVIIDISIDQGGCVETSRPTTPDQPTFTVHDVVHFCVPNMTSNLSRTASRVLSNASVSYLVELADKGLEGALSTNSGLAEGAYLYRGKVVNASLGKSLDVPVTPLARLLSEGGSR